MVAEHSAKNKVGLVFFFPGNREEFKSNHISNDGRSFVVGAARLPEGKSSGDFLLTKLSLDTQITFFHCSVCACV